MFSFIKGTAPTPSSSAAGGLPGNFLRLAWSNLAAQSAEQIALAAAPIIAVLLLGAGPGQTGLLQTAQTLPFLLLSIPAGLLADRRSRHRVMAWAEAIRTASLLAILALAETGMLSLPLLALLGFVGAAGTVAYSVAAPALVPSLVAPAARAAANGRIELARSLAFAAGPALGGLLVSWVGGAPAFGVAASLSLCAVLLLGRIREPARDPSPPRHIGAELAEGARFMFRHDLLRPMLFTAVVFNVAFFVIQAVYVSYAVTRLGLSAFGVGATLGCYGVGLVVGALLAPWIAARLPTGTVIVIGPLTGLAASLAVAMTILVASPLLAGLGYFLVGVGPVLWIISTTTLRQAVTPSAMLGRVSALNTMASYGARPVGAAIGALIGGHFGAEACLVVAVAGFLLQALIIFASAVPRLAQMPQAAE